MTKKIRRTCEYRSKSNHKFSCDRNYFYKNKQNSKHYPQNSEKWVWKRKRKNDRLAEKKSSKIMNKTYLKEQNKGKY